MWSYLNNMKRRIFSFISVTRKHKCLLLVGFTFFLIATLSYLYIFELIDVISAEHIFRDLVPVDVSQPGNFCPFKPADESSNLHFANRQQDVDFGVNEKSILLGGEWQPKYCAARYVVAIIVPYRDRESHLREFVSRIHSFVQKQYIHYRLYVIEQGDQKDFNRGKLFNVGFVEARKNKLFPCFIFHDVDLIPENENNIYACTRKPRHMSAAIDKFDYRPPYYRNFGGALAILADHFELVNGFSNMYYGWGGEDDDFYNRVRKNGLRPARFDLNISRYSSLHHEPAKPSEHRFDLLLNSSIVYSQDGLNSLQYSVISRSYEPLFTRIVVEL